MTSHPAFVSQQTTTVVSAAMQSSPTPQGITRWIEEVKAIEDRARNKMNTGDKKYWYKMLKSLTKVGMKYNNEKYYTNE